MVFLLNNERILVEIMELCTLRIAEQTMVKPDSVKVSIELKDGKINPSFGVDSCRLSAKKIQSTISSIWEMYKPELIKRMSDAQRNRIQS